MDKVKYSQYRHAELGMIYTAVSAQGLLAVGIGADGFQTLERVTEKTEAELIAAQGGPATAMVQIIEYLNAERTEFDVSIDYSPFTAFQKRVLETTASVPFGGVATYAEIARRLGNPAAARAVGQALARNPVPIVLPCHRVIASDGALQGFAAGKGIPTKAWLLKHEGVMHT